MEKNNFEKKSREKNLKKSKFSIEKSREKIRGFSRPWISGPRGSESLLVRREKSRIDHEGKSCTCMYIGEGFLVNTEMGRNRSNHQDLENFNF